MINDNNVVTVAGTVLDVKFSHKVLTERFYEVILEVSRRSKVVDKLSLIMSEWYLSDALVPGARVKVTGEFRSCNKISDNKSRLLLNIFVRTLECGTNSDDCNEITITGYICKDPNFRTTPLGRDICDILVAVNRSTNNKSDYLPTVLWGRNALRMSNCLVGDKVKVSGRIQSREYTKVYPDGTSEDRLAYEISGNYFERISQ